MTELTDYQRLVERPNLQRLREDHARSLGRIRDASFIMGMVFGVVISCVAGFALFAIFH